jgi:hypothetical protein
LKAMRRNDIAPCCVPALMTGVLQPLVTHVFAGLKRQARSAMDAARVAEPTGQISLCEAIIIWLRAVAVQLQRAQPAAFASVGLTLQQASLGSRCRARLELPPEWTPPAADLPSLEELRLLHGSKRELRLSDLFSWLAAYDRRADDTPPRAATSARIPRAQLLPLPPPVLTRTRRAVLAPWKLRAAPARSHSSSATAVASARGARRAPVARLP